MRTTDTTFDFPQANRPAASRLAALTQGIVAMWRLVKNRRGLARLRDLDDRQLADIGLSRHDVQDAVLSDYLDDPSRYLTRAARDRAERFYRDARRQ